MVTLDTPARLDPHAAVDAAMDRYLRAFRAWLEAGAPPAGEQYETTMRAFASWQDAQERARTWGAEE